MRVTNLDVLQRRTLIWAGLAVVLTAFDGSVLVLALPAIASDFHAQIPGLSNLGSVLALGSLGALPLATLADRFGRRRLIAIGVAGFSIANFASAFAPSLTALSFIRLVAVCFEALVASVATALIVEEAPPGRRGLAVSALAILGGAGLLVAIIVYPIVAPHWRWMFAAGVVGVAVAPLIWRHLPEGRTWHGVQHAGSALRVLAQAPWRRRVAILAASSALLAILGEPAGLFYTLFATTTLGLAPTGISLIIFFAGVAAVASYLPGGYLSDRFGRRMPGFVLTAGTTAATALGFVTGTVGFVAGNLLWSALSSAATPVIGAWSGELYPTRARATAEAISSVAAAFGGIVGLQLVSLLSARVGLSHALLILGVVALGGATLLLLLPETRGQHLPD
jgi:SHS family lactate transporter-like MFS transporter